MDLKKSWLEIESAVYKSRHAQYQFSSFVPSHFTFYKNILIFLGIPPIGESFTNENTLIYVDVESGAWEDIGGPSTDHMDGLEPETYLFTKYLYIYLSCILKEFSTFRII